MNDTYLASYSLFQEAWWLDAVAPNQWAEITVVRNGKTVARMPYTIKKRLCLNISSMPELTQHLGPWIEKKDAKQAKRIAWEKELTLELISQLPNFDYFNQNFHYDITNWLPFYWNNFSQTTGYSYVIEDLSDLDVVWSGFMENIRTDIRKASKKVIVHSTDDINKFIEVNLKTFKRQGMSLTKETIETIKRINAACGDSHRRIFLAEDEFGRIHAGVYIVYDERSAYYLMGGGDPELRNSGATSLLMWNAISFASKVTQKFDFEGSMIQPIERFFRAFGGVPKSYFNISQSSITVDCLKKMKKVLYSR